MSIDFVVKDKIETLLNQTPSIIDKETADIFCEEKLEEFEIFCRMNYPNFCECINYMRENGISQGQHCEVLEKIKLESIELRRNLKSALELFMCVSKFTDSFFFLCEELKVWHNELVNY
jgi:hypothetical protein